jgi:predicted ATPase
VLFCGYLLQSEVLSPLPFMFKSLKIENFRGFESFELKQLGRINLLVGENNSGKTSILEALLLLFSRVDLEPMSQVMLARGESVVKAIGNRETELPGLDIKHLFYGRDLRRGSRLAISGQHDNGAIETVKLAIQDLMFDPPVAKFDDQVGFLDDGGLELRSQWLVEMPSQVDPIEIQNRSFQLSPDQDLQLALVKRLRKETHLLPIKTQFISAVSVSIPELFRLFENIQLTPQEELVYQALRIIEPRCERIAGKATHSRFEVKLSDQNQPIPLGSMGDGMSRILRLALGLANAQGGVLIVDEIDTGLHFTAMTGMWKMLWEASEKLDVQVFATTHSRDCWESLTAVAESEGVQDNEIMIHRLEKGKESSVMFDSRQMSIAVEERLEVR